MLNELAIGASVVFSYSGIIALVVGCLLGTVVGILPGIGTVTTLSILLPYTYGWSPELSIIMMAGIYYGAQYAGSSTSILMNTPGEPSSIMTCIDGYAMTRQGYGGRAIVAAGLSSLIAGIITVGLMAAFASTVSELAFKFGAKELCLLMLLGLLSIGAFGNKNPLNGIVMGLIGVLLSTIGTDINSGSIRFTGGIIHLADGINIVVIAIGLFGIAEIFNNIFFNKQTLVAQNVKIGFSWQDFKSILPSSLRGTTVGSLLGLIPGGGAIMSSFAAYAFEKKVNKDAKLGKGAIQGVSAPESANNAAAQSGFIPLLGLGIPENPVMALMLATLILAGIQPGPGMIDKNPEIFWGLIVSMLLGNIILTILNIPLIKIWLKFLSIPRKILYPIVLTVSLVGVYYVNNSWFDVGLALTFGLIGLAFIKLDLEIAPLAFGFIIGEMFEEQLRRTLLLSKGDYSVFLESGISVFLVCVIVAVSSWTIYKVFRKKSNEISKV